VKLGENASMLRGILDQANALLAKAKSGWKLGRYNIKLAHPEEVFEQDLRLASFALGS